MIIRLDGQVALVTGGGRGLGRGMAVALGGAGARVGVVARHADQLDETVAMIRDGGGVAAAVVADITDPAAPQRAVDEVVARLGPVDVLVNNAGANSGVSPVWEVDPAQWWHDVQVNLYGPFLFARAVLPGMLERGSGRIVNIASGVANGSGAFDSAYGASKAGLVRFTDALAGEVQGKGVAVFALSPGSVKTQMTLAIAESPETHRWLGDLGGRLTYESGERAARAVVFLASGAGDGLTGRYFHVSDDVEALAARAAEVAEHDLFQLRNRTWNDLPS